MKQLKIYTLVVLLLIGQTLFAQKDSARISASAAQKVYAAALASRVIQERLDTCQGGILILNGRIIDLEKQVNEYSNSRSRDAAIMRSYVLKIQTCESENITILNELTALQLKFKRRQRINFIVTVGAIAGSAVGTILLLK